MRRFVIRQPFLALAALFVACAILSAFGVMPK